MKKEHLLWVVVGIIVFAMMFNSHTGSFWPLWWLIFVVPAARRRRRATDMSDMQEHENEGFYAERPKREPEYLRTVDGELLEIVDAPDSLENRF